ncbi:MAG: RDD family protein [Wenzhouxiangella sp.]
MKPCTLARRLAAIVYDGLLIIALWMAATALIVVVRQAEIAPASPLFQLYLLVVAWLYLAICWRAGQTLGMKAWRIRLQAETPTMSWWSTIVRFLTAILSWIVLGLGFWWSLFHPQSATWHDLASATRLVVLPRNSATNDAAQPRRQR